MTRGDIAILGMPLTEMCAAHYPEPRQRQLYRNMVYVGALAALLDIDFAVLEDLVAERFKGKDKLIEANGRALRLGYEDAQARFACPLGIRVRRSKRSATASWSKAITPPRSARSTAARRSARGIRSPLRPRSPRRSSACAAGIAIDPATGQKNVAIVQAEDEIAAIGMVVGAGWNGARAFTATSGPGVSLMQEFFGLAYFAEVPVVVIDVQRGGPSTGMPTRTQQSDLLVCAYASHGDTKHVMLIPDGPNEAFEFAARRVRSRRTAADAGVRHARPRHRHELALSRAVPMGRGAPITTAERCSSLDELEKVAEFGRYNDVDGDGVPYRTLPGAHPTRGAYFTRGTSRDRYARYTEDPAPYVDNMERLELQVRDRAQACCRGRS